ncbi:MAG: FIST N-terminal domain-containing protein [Cyanobacteria bacterium P01_D01_bin.156]
MFKVAVGHSIDPDSSMAIDEALGQCQQQLAGIVPQAGLLLSAVDFDHGLILRKIQATFPGMALIGGTTVGEMSSVLDFQEDSLSLMLFASDEVTIQSGLGTRVSQDAIAATRQAIPDLNGRPAKLCYTVGESLGVDGVDIVNGLQAALGEDVTIFGGLTGDDWKFKQTYQFFGDQVLSDAVTTLVFSGNLMISCGVATGLRPIGRKGIVTKSQGNTVHTIDNQSVKHFYAQYMGDSSIADVGGAWGGSVAVFEPGEENFYVRGPNSQDEASGSIDYFGQVPEQAHIQLTESNTESLLNAASQALKRAQADYQGTSPSVALIVSCAARMKSLGTRTREEYAVAQSVLGKLPNIGFHAYGEICPLGTTGKSFYHNETFTTVLLGTH